MADVDKRLEKYCKGKQRVRASPCSSPLLRSSSSLFLFCFVKLLCCQQRSHKKTIQCPFGVGNGMFGGDPCPGVQKKFAVVYTCEEHYDP